MVPEALVLNHKIYAHGIKVDLAKIEVIEKMSPPTLMKAFGSFLGYAWFCRRFIKDFSKIITRLCNILERRYHSCFMRSA